MLFLSVGGKSISIQTTVIDFGTVGGSMQFLQNFEPHQTTINVSLSLLICYNTPRPTLSFTCSCLMLLRFPPGGKKMWINVCGGLGKPLIYHWSWILACCVHRIDCGHSEFWLMAWYTAMLVPLFKLFCEKCSEKSDSSAGKACLALTCPLLDRLKSSNNAAQVAPIVRTDSVLWKMTSHSFVKVCNSGAVKFFSSY